MRRKFFLIILGYLTVAITVVSILQAIFFEAERLDLLDQNLESIASSLIASGLSIDLVQNLESTNDLISDLLKEERIDRLITIYSRKGIVLAQNLTAQEFIVPFEDTERLKTYEVRDRSIRVLTIPHDRLYIQVGIILNPSLQRYTLLNSRLAFFVGFIFLILSAVATLASRVLFRPLATLALDFSRISDQMNYRLGQPLQEHVVGFELTKLAKKQHLKTSGDEFEVLCYEIESFFKKLHDYTLAFTAQSTILSHELKTPLTLLRNRVEEIQRESKNDRQKQLVKEALEEINDLTHLINSYLQWSVLVSNPETPQLSAIKLEEKTIEVTNSLNLIFKQRIRIEGHSKLRVFALPSHLEQLISNLLTNSLKYSSDDSNVKVILSEDALVIHDQGIGIPQSVLDHLGTPFNRGPVRSPLHRSSGLGLAWVQSICQKYQWNLKIDTSATGTKVQVQFSTSD